MADIKQQDEAISAFDMFEEPAGFYEAPKEPTFAEHKLLSGDILNIRLVGHNPLWVRRIRLLDHFYIVSFRILLATVFT